MCQARGYCNAKQGLKGLRLSTVVVSSWRRWLLGIWHLAFGIWRLALLLLTY